MVQTSSRSPMSTRHPTAPQRQKPMLGLAGLAVGLVVTSNLGLPLTGGYLAVDVLMVAIGYQLARGVRSSVNRERWLQRFWLTMFARIMAPLGLSLGLMAGYWGWRGTLDESKVRELIGGAGLLLNFLTILGHAGSMALEHLWLIAMIGQFVVVLPLLVAGGRRYLKPDRRVSALIGLAAGIALCRIWLLLAATISSESIAINTLTRVDGLLIGAAIGVCPLASLRNRLPIPLAPAAFAGILLLFVIAPEQSAMPIVTLGILTPMTIALAAIVTAAQAVGNPSQALAATLDNQVLRWLGDRAFSIYIWHSLFGFTISADQLGATEGMREWPGLAVFIVRLVFSLAAAAVSHRYLEVPAMAVAEALVDHSGRPPSRPSRKKPDRQPRRTPQSPEARIGRYSMANAATTDTAIPKRAIQHAGAVFVPIPVVSSGRTQSLSSRPPSVFHG